MALAPVRVIQNQCSQYYTQADTALGPATPPLKATALMGQGPSAGMSPSSQRPAGLQMAESDPPSAGPDLVPALLACPGQDGK